MKFYLAVILILALSLTTTAEIRVLSDEPIVQGFEQFGPRIDSLFIKLYEDEYGLQNDLETGAVDILDYPVPQSMVERWSQAPYNETITMETHFATRMYVLDLNNNETIPSHPNWRSPTSYPEFRQAIAHLVNKTRIVTEILQGYGMEMSTPVFPWASAWFNPDAGPYSYNPEEAAALLDATGFVQGSTPNPDYDPSKPASAQFIRVYPPGHEKAGQDLDSLIFYVRFDDAARNNTGHMVRDELQNLGIPVTIPGPVRIQIIENTVKSLHDYHMYTGGWHLSSLPDYLFDLYHSFNYYDGGINYNHVDDSQLDYWLASLSTAQNAETAKAACLEAQRRLAEIAGVVPLWCPAEVNAYRKVSDRSPAGWSGIINHKSLGVDCDWTFLNIHQNNSEQGGTVNYGLVSPVEDLNPLNPTWLGDSLVLSKLYDSLLDENPDTLELMPSLAESFEIGEWFNPNTGVTGTKFTFRLRPDIYWHDGTPFTSADVKFTLDCLLQYKTRSPKPWAYYEVSMVEFVGTPDPYTVDIYTESSDYWPIHYISQVLIIPTRVWKNMSLEDALEPMPDPNLMGTGPFRLAEYIPEDHMLLEANDDYFIYCPIQSRIGVNSCRIDPYGTLDFNVSILNCFVDKSVDTVVSVYFDDELVEEIPLALEPNVQVDLGTFTVLNLEPGMHEIRVAHPPESYLGRACNVSMYVWSTIAEDLNLDACVDISDVSIAAHAFGAYPNHDRWDVLADTNQDFFVDILDVATIAVRFGWTP